VIGAIVKPKKIKKCIITGGPGTGKTTLIQELKRRQYQVVEEIATIIIKRELEAGREHPTIDRDKFEQEIMNEQLSAELSLNSRKISFLDRGVVDGLIYYELDGLEVPQALVDHANTAHYDAVFFLDYLEFYEQTEVRTEPFDVAMKNHKLLKRTYEDFGYADKIIDVPALEIEKRVDFVLDKILELEELGNESGYIPPIATEIFE